MDAGKLIGIRLVAALLALAGATAVSAATYTATVPINGGTDTLLLDPAQPFNKIWFGAGYDTPAYQALYSGYVPAHGGFFPATTLTPTAGKVFAKKTVAILGTGNYKFTVLQPGTTATQTTTYDLISALYVLPGTTEPFNSAALQSNLVAFSDDDTATYSRNPFPLHYINNTPGCVTATVLIFPWSTVANPVADFSVEGPGIIADTCEQAVQINSKAVPVSGPAGYAVLVSLLLGLGGLLLGRKRR